MQRQKAGSLPEVWRPVRRTGSGQWRPDSEHSPPALQTSQSDHCEIFNRTQTNATCVDPRDDNFEITHTTFADSVPHCKKKNKTLDRRTRNARARMCHLQTPVRSEKTMEIMNRVNFSKRRARAASRRGLNHIAASSKPYRNPQLAHRSRR